MAKIPAQIISILFHPLFLPTYVLMLLMMMNPYAFGFNSIVDTRSHMLILRVFLSTFFIPGFAVFIMQKIGLIPSFQMREKQERIGPYLVTGLFYLWMVRNFWSNPYMDNTFTSFMLGATISLFIAFFINNFSKISMHAVGMGGFVGLLLIALFKMGYNQLIIPGVLQIPVFTVLLIAVIFAGLVGTVRLLLNRHEPIDVYGGYLVGFIGQLIAMKFVLM